MPGTANSLQSGASRTWWGSGQEPEGLGALHDVTQALCRSMAFLIHSFIQQAFTHLTGSDGLLVLERLGM